MPSPYFIIRCQFLLLCVLLMTQGGVTAFTSPTIKNQPLRPPLSLVKPSQWYSGKFQQPSTARSIDRKHFSVTAATATQLQASPRPLVAATSPLVSMIVLGAIVLIHECGHYLVARWFRIEVLEFSIGMGPKLFGFHALGNDFSLRAIPMGGYVQFAGEPEDEEKNEENGNATNRIEEKQLQQKRPTDPTRWLQNRPWWERAIVLCGGVAFNFILSYMIYFGLLSKAFQKVPEISITPFQTARVTRRYTRRLIQHTATGLASGFWGMIQSTMAPLVAPLMALFSSSSVVEPILTQELTQGAVQGAAKAVVTGPIQIIKTGSDIAYHHGMEPLLLFAAHLSVNLGVLNAFPIPLFDGGQLVIVLFEGITGRKLPTLVERTVNLLTMLLLLFAMMSASLNDVIRLLS